MNDVEKRTPKLPPLETITDGRGMDSRVEIGRYTVIGKIDMDSIVPNEELTEDEKAEVLRNAPLCSDTFKGWVATPNWVIWEDVDGNLHVYNGRNEDGSVRGDGVIVPRV